jgi:hypothetical protein
MIKLNGDTIGDKEINTNGNFSERDTNIISGSTQGQLSGFDPNNSFSVSGLSLGDSGVSIGDQFNFDNTLGSVIELNDTSTPSYTIPGSSGSDEFKSAFGNARKSGLKEFEFGGKKYNTNLSTDPNFGKDKVVEGQKSFTGRYTSPGTPDTPEVRVDAFSNLGRRQQIRGIKTGTAMEKRNTMKAARNEAKSIKGKNIFETLKLRKEFKKNARTGAKTKMTDDRASQFKVVNEQRRLQNEQGVNHRLGKKDRVVTQKGVKGSSSTPASKDKETMEQYFKRRGVGGIVKSPRQSKQKNTNSTF